MRAVLFLIVIGAGILSAWYGRPFVHDNNDAIIAMVTIITVFAGFLIALMAILADPSMLPPGSWRKIEVRRPNIEAKITRTSVLFYIYLLALAFLFAGALFSKDQAGIFPEVIKEWIERVYLFLSVVAFLFTFSIPATLGHLQLMRLNAETERRRTESGIKAKE